MIEGLKAPIHIHCIYCREHIYTLNHVPQEGDIIKAVDFTPALSSIPQPKRDDLMKCPKCGQPFTGTYGDKHMLMVDRNYQHLIPLHVTQESYLAVSSQNTPPYKELFHCPHCGSHQYTQVVKEEDRPESINDFIPARPDMTMPVRGEVNCTECGKAMFKICADTYIYFYDPEYL